MFNERGKHIHSYYFEDKNIKEVKKILDKKWDEVHWYTCKLKDGSIGCSHTPFDKCDHECHPQNKRISNYHKRGK